ncbi:epidermal growth factor-like protein 7 isoform X2 [Strigops habroptila]|uniref:epidermal growth factor-like protein 7 isoform X2 n=1 Tax=Strigops habroptila TaxID=2489341 RepID=UPI0011CEF757|nr:epidermal growth factor-like protein 7 isoform X2 [Strigops habroptila]
MHRGGCLLLGLLFTLSVTSAAGLARAGRRVCVAVPRSRAISYTESHVQPVYQPYLTTCQGHLCSTYRTIYRVGYRQAYKQLPQPMASCCPGWSRADGHALGCNRDVDECTGQSHGCSQLCLNTAGSYHCACRDGFSLAADHRSCQPLVPAPEPGAFSQAGPPSEVKEEMEDLRSRVEALEQKLQLVLAPFHNLMPSAPEDVGTDPISRLSHSLQQLDRIESLSEQISFLEERLETCSCKNEL